MLALSHKKLIAWQKAIQLLPLVYNVCLNLPREEMYNLTGQMKRAALSISNNLAEGSSRRIKAEKCRFFEIARSSVVEIDSCLSACVELKFLKPDGLHELNNALLEEFKLLTGLIDANSR